MLLLFLLHAVTAFEQCGNAACINNQCRKIIQKDQYFTWVGEITQPNSPCVEGFGGLSQKPLQLSENAFGIKKLDKNIYQIGTLIYINDESDCVIEGNYDYPAAMIYSTLDEPNKYWNCSSGKHQLRCKNLILKPIKGSCTGPNIQKNKINIQLQNYNITWMVIIILVLLGVTTFLFVFIKILKNISLC